MIDIRNPYSKKGKLIDNLATLGKLLPFMEAIETTLGKELLADLVDKRGKHLDKISKVECKDEEKVEFKVVSELLAKWSNRVTQYYKLSKEVDEQMRKGNG